MSTILLTTGRLTERPYRLQKIERNVYSVEELCYSLAQSAQFLDASVMDPLLVDWLDKECGLTDLADLLRRFLGHSRQLADFVAAIMEYTGYVSPESERSIRETIAEGAGMEPLERRMRSADYMAENGRAHQAIAEYRRILEDLPAPELQMRHRLLQKIGRLYCTLFRFDTAAEYYLKAYETARDPESYLSYLTAVRLSSTQEEYVAFVSEHPEAYDYSLTLEQRMETVRADYETGPSARGIRKLENYLQNGHITSFEIELDRMIKQLKEDYRRARSV